jgi:hypothetical protein
MSIFAEMLGARRSDCVCANASCHCLKSLSARSSMESRLPPQYPSRNFCFISWTHFSLHPHERVKHKALLWAIRLSPRANHLPRSCRNLPREEPLRSRITDKEACADFYKPCSALITIILDGYPALLYCRRNEFRGEETSSGKLGHNGT